MKKSCLALVLALSAASIGHADKTLKTDNDVTLDVLGQSGKMRLDRGKNEVITITMDSIIERNSGGDKVGQAGPNSGKHSRETFASTDFSFGSIYNTEIDGVNAVAVDFDVALIDGVGTLKIQTLLFQENGTITPTDGEEFEVSEGSMKFNIEVSDWPFCTSDDSGLPCRGETGDFLDVAVTIQGNEGIPEQSGEAGQRAYPIGSNSEILVSKKVQIEGDWRDMPAGYPTLDSDGDKYTITVRFPAFDGTAVYDPVIGDRELNGSSSEQLTPGGIAGVTIAVVVVVILIAVGVVYLVRRRRGSGAGANKA